MPILNGLVSSAAKSIFDDNWLRNAQAKGSSDSWADDVIETLDTTGQIYLSTLNLWFHLFPLSSTKKQNLRKRLESFQTDEHLGGVNELTWWAFMQREGISCKPLTSLTSCPDFQLQPPADCFVEVSTLNVSNKDKSASSVALDDHAQTISRVFGKLTSEKHKQLMYAANKAKPGVLALFDYTPWSAYGTQLFRALGDALLGTHFAFKNLPSELSAIVYLERQVQDGRIVLSRQRSATYYNPLALHPLQQGAFSSLSSFSCQCVLVQPNLVEPWLRL